MRKSNIYIISIGGSIIVPDDIDYKFLYEFRNIIENEIKKGKRFIFITGGGKTARKYQQAAKKLTKVFDEDLDWLGIHSTRINAHLCLIVFRDYSYYRVIKNPKEKIYFRDKVLIAAGWRPGFSTDYDAVMLAKTYNSKIVVNLTDVDYVYDKNPYEFKDVKSFKRLKWEEYLNLIQQKWYPGFSSPFDPVASKLAKKYGITCFVLNGRRLENLKKFLEGNDFKGTIIQD